MSIEVKNSIVSILIPSYNSEPFLRQTLESCLSQTWKNIEIIVVDDQSTDRSIQILENFQTQNPGVLKFYRNPMKGACAARNLAFKASSGNYIQYLDADDLLSRTKIESQIRLLQYKENTVSNCQWGRFNETIENIKWEIQDVDKNYFAPIDWLIDSWNGKGMTAIHCWLTPRNLIEKAGEWDEKLLINQDGEFFSRVLLNTDAIKYSSEAKAFYRTGNKSSISQSGRMSYPKAESLLKTYKSYQETWQQKSKAKTLSQALAQNYLNFIYLYYPLHEDLIIKAETLFKSLGFQTMWPVGGRNFKKVAGLIGFKNTLKLRSLFTQSKKNS